MLAKWSPVLGLAILGLNVSRIAALEPRSLISTLESGLESALHAFESAVVKVVTHKLDGNGGILADFPMDYSSTPPISSRLLSSGLHSDVEIGLYCASCENAVQPSNFDFASTSFSGWSNSWLGLLLHNFDAEFELEIDLSGDVKHDFTLSLLNKTFQQYGVEVELDFQLYLVAEAQADMTFNAGLNLSLTQPAAIMMPAFDPLVQLDQSERIGFNKSHFKLTPIFNASVPQVDFKLQLSLRTVLSITVEDFNVGALFLDLPAFQFDVATLTNALSTCNPAPSGTPSDQIYTELIHLNGALVAELSYELFGDRKSGVIDSWDIWDAVDKCYAFFPGLGYIGAVPSTSQSALLTAPPITVCKTGTSTGSTNTVTLAEALGVLSPGAKAGAVIGTLAGVSLVAILAFFAGRGSLGPAVKKAGASSPWITTVTRPRRVNSRRFFGLANVRHRRAQEFFPVTPAPTEQIPQISPYALTRDYHYSDGGFPTLGTDMDQHGGFWQMFPRKPFPDGGYGHDAVTPATTTFADDAHIYGHGIPSSGFGEVSPLAAAQRREYARSGAGEAEELGLLQSPERSVAQRTTISRKPVPVR